MIVVDEDEIGQSFMDRVDITLNLPQELVEQAQSAGLLSEEKVESWLIDELDRQSRLNRLFDKLDRLARVQPPMTEEEINAEIQAHRSEKRRRGQE